MQKIIDLKKQNLFNRTNFVLLCLGSNIEPKEKYLKNAIEFIQKDGFCEILKVSKVLKNPPLIYTNQDDFLNQILEIKTILDPYELLTYIKQLEKNIGRIERFRYGPREIDIDILFYENLKINTEILTIPHPGIYDREYIQILLQEFNLSKYS